MPQVQSQTEPQDIVSSAAVFQTYMIYPGYIQYMRYTHPVQYTTISVGRKAPLLRMMPLREKQWISPVWTSTCGKREGSAAAGDLAGHTRAIAEKRR